jgi:hypothetical protein
MTPGRVTPGEFWLTLRVAVSALGRKRILVPFLLYGAAQLGVLASLSTFHAPGLSPVAEPIVRSLGGEVATHYPQFYIVLPSIVEKAFAVLHMVLGSLLMGAATVMLWTSFVHRPCTLHEAFVKARRRYPQLLGIAVVVDVLAVTLSTLAYRLASGENGGILAAPFAARGGALFLALLVQTLMAYAVPSLLISNSGFLGALWRTAQLAARNPVTTFIVVTVAFLPHVPLRYVASKSLFIVENLKPELVAWLTGLDVLVAIVTGFFVVAAITRLYLFAVREE